MKTNLYIDGFNLYYGCLKGTKYRWLDLAALCKALSPKDPVNRIRYFTARVRTQPTFGPGTEQRQQVYLRALATLPVDIHFGHYQLKPKWAYEYPQPATGPRKVQILKPDEKGSDVNLAAYLLLDGFQGDYDRAFVISNDADLATPIRLVRDELKLPVGVVFPCTNPKRVRSAHLLQVATKALYRDVRVPALQASQFPITLTDALGTFSCPTRWA